MEEKVKELCLDPRFLDVEGWLNPNVADVVVAWTEYFYSCEGYSKAAALEIGVHHGRFFLVLEASTPAPLKCYAYDLFDELQSKNIDGSGKGNKEAFLKNVEEFAQYPHRVQPIEGDSFSIRAAPVPHSYNLISIDGGHSREHTAYDLQYANDTIMPGGLVVLDDFTNPNWLGVMEGLFDFLGQPSRRICPMFAGFNKLFLTTISECETTRSAMESSLDSKLGRVSQLKGYPVRALVAR